MVDNTKNRLGEGVVISQFMSKLSMECIQWFGVVHANMCAELRWRVSCYGLTIYVLLSSPAAWAGGGIATDGSLGVTKTFTGDSITISPADSPMGLRGKNLFHSFTEFNIQSGQTVTFSEESPGALNNIIARVTGGEQTSIDGRLQVTPGGQANFYLLNPNGVFIGEHAKINIPGVFHVGAADALNFDDKTSMKADTSSSTFSAATPTTFGILGKPEQNNSLIRIENAILNKDDLNSGMTGGISLEADKVDIINSTLIVPMIKVIHISFASQSESSKKDAVALNINKTKFLNVNNLDFNLGGDELHMMESSIDKDKGSSAFNIAAGSVVLDGVNITARNVSQVGSEEHNVDGLQIRAGKNIEIKNDTNINFYSSGTNSAPFIQMKSNYMSLKDGSEIVSQLILSREDKAYSNSGIIIIDVNTLDMANSTLKTEVSGSSPTGAQAGAILIKGNRAINIQGSELSTANNSEFFAIQSHSANDSLTKNGLNPADIKITSKDVVNLNEDKIYTSAIGSIDSGAIVISSGFLKASKTELNTSSVLGSGGIINMDSKRGVFLDKSTLSTTRTGSDSPSNDSNVEISGFYTQHAGDIRIKSPLFSMYAANVNADNNSNFGKAGKLDFNEVDFLLPIGFVVNHQPFFSGPDFFSSFKKTEAKEGYNIISAFNQNGVSGLTKLNPIQLNLSGVLASLATPQFSNDLLMQDFCAIGAGSSLTVEGHGALPATSEDLLLQ